ncbi:hypothetical protein ILUMI_22462 [Ignelater luminosus]|uniref:Lipase domain-containing protein n=1 Tax=Ignelater luminosus TaxID=2038154 RepID=A0A8K0CEC9_IGNLU|nr:hypothetical protein ILUMI_22462 [Ignelater luminosus]
MAFSSSLFFLLAVFTIEVLSNYDDLQVKDLSPDLQRQLQYMLDDPFRDQIKTNCTTPTSPEVKYLLYTRTTPNLPIIIDPTNPHQISARTKFVMVVPGWLQSPSSKKIVHLKDEYIKRYDLNLVIVDWSQAAFNLYNLTFCDMPFVGQSIADFICTLADQRNLHPGVIHAIGHSLGAQVLGLTAEYLRGKCAMEIGRITGLDISGILFEKLPDSQRLDKSDAELVDIIHSDTLRGFGFWLNIGDVDFHPNCGHDQPGCPYVKKLEPDTMVSDIFCSSDRSVEYLAESVNDNNLIGKSCGICPRSCQTDIINEVYAYMGEECRDNPKPAKRFIVPTNEKSPYGRGWGPFPVVHNSTKCVDEIGSPCLRSCKIN